MADDPVSWIQGNQIKLSFFLLQYFGTHSNWYAHTMSAVVADVFGTLGAGE